jgi:4'-phosphopantetheinyl transferase
VEVGALYWREQRRSDVASGYDWLSGRERMVLEGLRFTPRRASWRLGRWTAKRAVASCLGRDGGLEGIEVVAASDGAPEAIVDGAAAPVCVSISHSGDRGFCVVAGCRSRVGCDVERVEARGSAFARDYLTASERRLLHGCGDGERALRETLIWSAKESALKALRDGLRRDTRDVEVDPAPPRGDGEWNPLSVVTRGAPGGALVGWWRADGGWVYTMVSDVPTPPPISLT